MSLIEWTDDLSVGVPLMDRHHQKLIALLRSLYDAFQRGDTSATVEKVLQELWDYTVYHFSEEERLLAEAGYPSLENHKLVHQMLTSQVKRMMNDYREDPRNVYAAELYQFLSGWLISHIKTEDFAYRPWVAPAAAPQ